MCAHMFFSEEGDEESRAYVRSTPSVHKHARRRSWVEYLSMSSDDLIVKVVCTLHS